ncbi:MAG: 3-oxoacyl-ACP synthase, partial [Catenulispora sp.]|nr:3-oxoacyl-ACP synthase [Catenulispora sp.]
ADLAVEAGRAALDRSTATPDALILCSTRFDGGAESHGGFVAEVTAGLGLPDVAFLGITLNRCTNLLTAIDVATAFVGAGRHERVLVVTTDRAAAESERMTKFALFSDGAAACLVTRDPGEYAILATATAQRTADLDWSHEISSDLAREVNEQLLKAAGITLAEVTGLAHTNLYVPLVAAKERLAGFSADQLYTANVERVGHCFAADPLINLADRGPARPGEYHVLAASVPGARAGVLLRAR